MLCDFIQSCFANKNIPDSFKDTLITLILKIENPESLTHFCPISLCNVLCKTLTKVLVSRLRSALSNVVGPFQNSFVPGRSTCDNIIIAQEIVHNLRSKKGKKCDMILKIDLKRSYDNVSWQFLSKTLVDFNLNDHWIELIINCVTNVKASMLWNGEKLKEFSMEKGLRQGDPFSPYLFVLCMERLSNMIMAKVNDKGCKGVKASAQGPVITHLFFADDLLLFGKADEKKLSKYYGCFE